MPSGDGVCEMEEHPGVALHRSAHVAQQHERPRSDASCAPAEFHDIPSGAEALADGSPQVNSWSASADPPARTTFARVPDETRERLPCFDDFRWRERGEVSFGEAATIAPCFDRV